jgi:hypothetical protein
MKKPPMYRIKYEFINGITCEFFISSDIKNPIHRVEWSKDIAKLKRQQKAKLLDEYFYICVPFVYQKIANYIGQKIMWVDQNCILPPKVFEPELNLS